MILRNAPLHFPKAREWMWDYCVYLGPFTYEDKNYDLGVYVCPDGTLSAAVVYADEPGSYISGTKHLCITEPASFEAFKRAHAIGL